MMDMIMISNASFEMDGGVIDMMEISKSIFEMEH